MIKACTEAITELIKTLRTTMEINFDLHPASLDLTLSKINLRFLYLYLKESRTLGK